MRDLEYGMLQDFFFRAMRHGWASGNDGQESRHLPGHRRISHSEGEFKLVDQWTANPLTNRSAGTTTIWFQNVPVWTMSYGGLYKPEAVPIVRRALNDAYSNKVFYGGRGEFSFGFEGYEYVNRLEDSPQNGMIFFRGREGVSIRGHTGLGYHHYWGMVLVAM